MRKTILIVFIIITIIFSNTITLARIGSTGINLYSKNSYTSLIKYDGKDIELEYVVYNYNGKEYPAYSQDYELPGITTENSYKVDIRNEIYDMSLWRIITNGYPYNSYAELGCNNAEEAYLATKLAIYNYFYNYEIEKLEASNQMGQNVIEAMKYITDMANTLTISREYPVIQILSGTDYEWKLDNETDYLYKIYKIECKQTNNIKTKLLLEGEIPEGTIITNISNEEKEEFEYGEDIKISIPRINLVKSGEFNIRFTFKCKTFPVYYAVPKTTNYNGYILTDDGIEEITRNQKEEYTKQSAQVHIEVLDAKTRKPLSDVEFEFLNKNKEYISTYKTDENGRFVINAFVGDYYLKQTEVGEEYSIFNDLISVEMRLNKQFGITFMLNKKEEIVLETEHKDIIISETDKVISLGNGLLYIMNDMQGCAMGDQLDKSEENQDVPIQDSEQKEDKNNQITEDTENMKDMQEKDETTENTDIKQDVQKEDEKKQISEVIKTTANVKKLPRTGM